MKKKLITVVSLILVVSLSVVFGVVAENIEKPRILELRLKDDHPGLPGYDLKLNFSALYGTEGDMDRITKDDFTLSCDVEEVVINGDSITIPASFKDTTTLEGFNVYAKYNDDTSVVTSYPISLKNWSLVLEDNFDGTELNSEYWTVNNGDTLIDVGDGATWVADAHTVSVKDGNMVMQVMRNYGEGNSDATFLTSSITSKFSQNEGVFMSSIKMPTRGGCNTAFWTVPTSGGWGQEFFVRGRSGKNEGFVDGEFDIVEYSPNWTKNGVPYYWCTDHWWNELTFERRSSGEGVAYEHEELATEYVNFALAWTPVALYYYCDGELIKTIKNIENTGEEATIRYTIGEGSYNDSIYKWAGGFTDEDIPYMVAYVDYFKMYK